jgi:uncharacterized protein (TIGR02300 family)
MAKPELGTKRVCVSCGAKFYDLTKTPAVCPKCGTEQPPEQPRVRRSGGNVLEEKRRAKVVPVPGVEDPDVETDADAEEAEEVEGDVLEDTSDLEDGADAIVEVETGEEER